MYAKKDKSGYHYLTKSFFETPSFWNSKDNVWEYNTVLGLLFKELTTHTVKLDKDVTDFLISICVLIIEDREEIDKQTTGSLRNAVLLSILKDRPFDTVRPLLNALKDSDEGNDYTQNIILRINGYLNRSYDCVPSYFGCDNVSDHKLKLQKSYKVLVQQSVITEVCEHLIESHVISFEEKEEISAACTTSERNRRLLGLLLRKDFNAYSAFLDALKHCQNTHLADLIDKTEITCREKRMIQTGIEMRRKRMGENLKREHTEELPPKLMPRRVNSEHAQPRRGNTDDIPVKISIARQVSMPVPLGMHNRITKEIITDFDASHCATAHPESAKENVDDSRNCFDLGLHELDCYHSNISREEAEALLLRKPTGSYLIRPSSEESTKYALSILTKHRIVHNRFSYYDGNYILDQTNGDPLVFDSLQKVMAFFQEGIHFTESGFVNAERPVSCSKTN